MVVMWFQCGVFQLVIFCALRQSRCTRLAPMKAARANFSLSGPDSRSQIRNYISPFVRRFSHEHAQDHSLLALHVVLFPPAARPPSAVHTHSFSRHCEGFHDHRLCNPTHSLDDDDDDSAY